MSNIPAHRCNGNPAPHHGTQNKCTICGAYRNGWFDPVSGLEIRAPTGKVSERDEALALNIAEAFFNDRLPVIDGRPFASAHSNPTLNLADKIAAALATKGRDEREAALKDAIEIVKGEVGGFCSTADGSAAKAEIVAALEAAAIKDESDGR